MTDDDECRPGADAPELRVVDTDRYVDWEEIYRDNVERVYRLLYSKVGNRVDAEDLTTEVFLAALPPMRTNASRAEIRGYLAATARTVLATYWRRRLGVEATVIEMAAAMRFLDDPPTESDAPARAARVMETLPDRFRRILELRFLDGLSIKEAAQEMGVSVANAKVLQHRAVRLASKAVPGWAP